MHTHRRFLLSCLALVLLSVAARAQGTSGPTVSDSRVGYIDPAIPANLFRFRYDTAYDDHRPTRAEFFYPKGGPRGPGLPEPERSVDFQDLMTYLEVAPLPDLSAFVEVPVRFLNPELNADHGGLGDVNAGFKYAFLQTDDLVATFQFRTYAPTGDSHRGLGTHHVSLEPALLLYDRLTDRLGLESEFRVWVPVGGTDYAGNIVRYGIGAHYDVLRSEKYTISPVVEFVGWTVLDGKEAVVAPSRLATIKDAGGDTIVNAKVGLRVRFGDCVDVYGGYGRPLTGDRWYENILRLEFRLLF
jgi:hypothetical protein